MRKEFDAGKNLSPEIINITSFANIKRPTEAGSANNTKILVNRDNISLYSFILFFPKSIANLGTVTTNIAAISVLSI